MQLPNISIPHNAPVTVPVDANTEVPSQSEVRRRAEGEDSPGQRGMPSVFVQPFMFGRVEKGFLGEIGFFGMRDGRSLVVAGVDSLFIIVIYYVLGLEGKGMSRIMLDNITTMNKYYHDGRSGGIKY